MTYTNRDVVNAFKEQRDVLNTLIEQQLSEENMKELVINLVKKEIEFHIFSHVTDCLGKTIRHALEDIANKFVKQDEMINIINDKCKEFIVSNKMNDLVKEAISKWYWESHYKDNFKELIDDNVNVLLSKLADKL